MSAAGGDAHAASVAQDVARMSLEEKDSAADLKTMEGAFASAKDGAAQFDTWVWCKNPGCGFLCATCNSYCHAMPRERPEHLTADAFVRLEQDLHPANHERRPLTLHERCMFPGMILMIISSSRLRVTHSLLSVFSVSRLFQDFVMVFFFSSFVSTIPHTRMHAVRT